MPRERRRRRRSKFSGHPRNDNRKVLVFRENPRTGVIYGSHPTGDTRVDVIVRPTQAAKPKLYELPGKEYFLLQELLDVLSAAKPKRSKKRSLRPPPTLFRPAVLARTPALQGGRR